MTPLNVLVARVTDDDGYVTDGKLTMQTDGRSWSAWQWVWDHDASGAKDSVTQGGSFGQLTVEILTWQPFEQVTLSLCGTQCPPLKRGEDGVEEAAPFAQVPGSDGTGTY